MNADTAPDVVAETRAWIEKFVIGLGLCPFPAAPFNAGRVGVSVCDQDDTDGVYQAFLTALFELFTSDPSELETSLLVVPQGLASFDDYLDMLEMLQLAVREAGAEGMVQVASFHPDYRFADAAADDPANFTNRSPYPMFHLIREDGLAAALESVADPDAIPARNIARLRGLGGDGIRMLLAQIKDQ